MFTLTDTGHTEYSKYLYNNSEFWLAIGTLPGNYDDPWVDYPPISNSALATITMTHTLDADDLITDITTGKTYTGILKSIKLTDGVTDYIEGTDFEVLGSSIQWLTGGSQPAGGATLTYEFRYVFNDSTDLLAEVIQLKASSKNFLVPDPQGSININGVLFSLSPANNPTRYIFLTFTFSTAYYSSALDIYQLGIRLNTIGDADHQDANFLMPNQIVENGALFAVENIIKEAKQAQKTLTFNILITS